MGAGAGPALRHGEAAARYLRDAAHRAFPPLAGTDAAGRRDLVAGAPGDRRSCAGRCARPAAAAAAVHLRGAGARLHHAPPGCCAGKARHRGGAGGAGDHRSPEAARRRHCRADAACGVDRRAAPAGARARQCLGLQSGELHGSGSAAGARRPGRDPRHRRGAACGGHSRGAGRGAEPHRRERCAGHHAVAARARRGAVLSACRWRADQRHRLRQYAGAGRARRAAAGHGCTAQLGHAHRHRRLPLRPRHGDGAHAARLFTPCAAAVGDRAGPAAVGAHDDRRAVGRGAGRLSARAVSGTLAGVERPLPRRGAPLLAWRCEHGRRLRDAHCGLLRHFRRRPPPALGRHQLHRGT